MKEAVILYKDAAAVAGTILGGISLGSALKSFLSLHTDLFETIINAYQVVVRDPLRNLLASLSLSLPALAADLLIVYALVGSVTIRALFKIYDPTSIRVIKGGWGRLSKWIYPGHRPIHRTLAKTGLFGLGVVFWPIIVFEYSVRYRNVWVRYLDDSGRPRLDGQIGVLTSNAGTVTELFPESRWARYNDRFDYQIDTDSWYALRGSFPAIYLTGLALTILAFLGLVILSYLSSL